MSIYRQELQERRARLKRAKVAAAVEDDAAPTCLFCHMGLLKSEKVLALSCGRVFHVDCLARGRETKARTESLPVDNVASDECCPMKCYRSKLPCGVAENEDGAADSAAVQPAVSASSSASGRQRVQQELVDAAKQATEAGARELAA